MFSEFFKIKTRNEKPAANSKAITAIDTQSTRKSQFKPKINAKPITTVIRASLQIKLRTSLAETD